MNHNLIARSILLGFGLLFAACFIVPLVRWHAPQVVVNMPADAKPLSVLDDHPKVVGGDRATLWYTVYHETYLTSSARAAADAADRAVLTVYGPAR